MKREEFIHSGIPGLDIVMNGGFEKNSVNIIIGGPGSGKSIFCTQFVLDGLKRKENCLYITFEEPKKKFYKHMKTSFNWDLAKYEKGGKFIFLEYNPSKVKSLLEEGGGLIENIIKKSKIKRVVIDSLTSFSLLYNEGLARREALLSLFNLFMNWGCTILLTSEHELNPKKYFTEDTEFEVDGVILLYNIRELEVRERALEILKLRGRKHATKIFPMKINNKGISIYPKENVFKE